jgi:hypothetical protein
MKTTKTQIEKIVLNRVEGPIELCGEFEALTWSQAEKLIQMWALTVPKQGYDKIDFTIVWKDGFTYEGRFDLERKHAEQFCNLSKHVLNHLTWYISGERPIWFNEARWEAAKEEAARILEQYDLGNA